MHSMVLTSRNRGRFIQEDESTFMLLIIFISVLSTIHPRDICISIHRDEHSILSSANGFYCSLTGAFGDVYKGRYSPSHNPLTIRPVAIKTIKGRLKKLDKNRFLGRLY